MKYITSPLAWDNGAPEEIRTPNLLIRSQVLYPVELRVRMPLASKVAQPNQLVRQVQARFFSTAACTAPARMLRMAG